MSTAFGVVPQFRTPAAAPIVAAIDRNAPLRARPRYAPWSSAEDGVIRERHMQGSVAVHALLPHRTRQAIRLRARKIGYPIQWVHGVGYRMPKRLAKKKAKRGTNPLVRKFVDVLASKNVSWTEIEEEAGVGGGTIRSWTDRTIPKLDTFIAALNVVGLDLKIVPAEEVKGQANYL